MELSKWNYWSKKKKKKNSNGSIKRIHYIDQIINVRKDSVLAANIFNEVFIKVGNEFSGKFIQTPIEQGDAICNYSFNETFLIPIETKEVLNIIQILKVIQTHIMESLTFIFNICLKRGLFPNKFKSAIVKHLYKLGNKDLDSNYRPISMLKK